MTVQTPDHNDNPFDDLFSASLVMDERRKALQEQMISKHPGMTEQEANAEIAKVERKYNYFFERTYPDDFARSLVWRRNRLAALAELDLATENEKAELGGLQAAFSIAIHEIFRTTLEAEGKIRHEVDAALTFGTASSLEEAKEIFIHGPIISGFEVGNDPSISNKAVAEFLVSTFGEENLRKAKIAKVTKDNYYLLNDGNKKEKRHQLIAEQVVTSTNDSFLLAKNRQYYEKAAMLLEEVSTPEAIRHLYKQRASAGSDHSFGIIKLRSFGVEKSSDFDYLADLELDTEEDKIRVLILGTIAHEVSHRYERHLKKDDFEEYRKIIENENMPGRRKYVTDYVLRHEEIYQSHDTIILREDLAEAVRIYTTHPKFLQEHYPRRFLFIQQKLPFIKAGSVIEFIKTGSK